MCCCRRKCETRGSFEIARLSHRTSSQSRAAMAGVWQSSVWAKGDSKQEENQKTVNNPEQDSQNSRGRGCCPSGLRFMLLLMSTCQIGRIFFVIPAKPASAFRWETRSGSCLIEFRIHGIVLLQLYFWAAVCGWVPYRPWLCCFGGEGVNTAVNRHYSQCSFSFIAATVVAKAACGT